MNKFSSVKFVDKILTLTDILGGYPALILSLFFTGILTVLLKDFALHFGCTVGLKDTITAVGLVPVALNIPSESNLNTKASNEAIAFQTYGYIPKRPAVICVLILLIKL
jgi:solute carrier family 8 (sodium/calcium exchanger)